MAYPGTPTIPRGEEHFFNLVYTGTSTGQTIGRFLPFTMLLIKRGISFSGN